MAKYDVTFSCGHTDTVVLFGKVKDRERKIEWYESSCLCPECYEAEKQRKFDEANAKATAEAKEYGLPELTGSEKQVAWANTLRQKWIAETEKWIDYSESRLERGRFQDNYEDAEMLRKAIAGMKKAMETRLLAETSARFWIDNRDEVVSKFLTKAGEKALQEPIVEVPQAVQQQALEEMVIRPSEPVATLVTDIRIKATVVSAKLPEKDEDFRKIVKDLRLEWKDGKWQRDISSETKGTPMDRAVELGIKLLAAGFPIRVYQDDLQQQILSGTYEPECDRWILIYEKGFRIWWNREEGDFYNEAKRLPGSRWISDKRSMYVPAEAFRDLQGFAEKYQFKFTTKAQEKLAEAAQAFESAMIAEVKVPKKEKLPQPGSVPEKLVVEEGTVDEELLDQN